MHNALIRKLESFEALTEDDRRALNAFVPRVRHVGARVDLVREGDAPEHIHLVLDGYACRYKVLPDGRRQIMAYFVPGDFCDLNVFILDQMDHSIGTVSACRTVDVPRSAIEEVTAGHPRITRAFLWCALVDEAILREWVVNLGAREANQRVAYLLCELLLRLDAVGRVTGGSYAFPFTQTDIADAMGLSSVHVNRVLRVLRELGLVTLKHRILTILDVERLKAYCTFNANYLHLENARWSNRRIANWLDQSQRA